MIGDKIAEGGQARIHEAKIMCPDPRWGENIEWVLKVFKKDGQACPLENLQRQWPEGMFKHHEQRVDSRDLIPRYNCDVQCGTLLEDGSFAFLKQREQADLRTLINQAMKLRTSQDCGPFSTEMAGRSMHQIAKGMIWLHELDIIHRDLKAANVLEREIDGEYYCYVADYECSVGVIGTGFHRAPEILRAIKDRLPYNQRELLFYEILTGKDPFEGVPWREFDVVLDGKLPEVPTYVDDWARELLRSCWKFNPAARPSFEDILNLLSGVLGRIAGDTNHERKAFWIQLVTEMLSMYKSAGEDLTPSLSALSDALSEGLTEVDNVEVFKNLQTHSTWDDFLLTFNEDALVLGEKFAEGGRAELFHAQINWQSQFHHEAVLTNLREYEILVKVFKRGTSLREWQACWNLGLLQYFAERINRGKTGTTLATSVMYLEWEKPRYISNILCGTVLGDGRIALLMEREQVDLRSLIDRKMLWRASQDCGPFSDSEIAEKIMHDIALGMDWMHNNNIVHRDIKASNVLIREDQDGSYQLFSSDYECSLGVVGTGFCRAPEILQACKYRTITKNLELFSTASDGFGCIQLRNGLL